MITASSTPTTKSFTDHAKRGRDKFEVPRKAVALRINSDLKSIAKEELVFAKSLIKHIIPIKVTVDKEAKGLKVIIPINIEYEEDQATNMSVSVVANSDKETNAVLEDF
jgi:hypothetical protein